MVPSQLIFFHTFRPWLPYGKIKEKKAFYVIHEATIE